MLLQFGHPTFYNNNSAPKTAGRSLNFFETSCQPLENIKIPLNLEYFKILLVHKKISNLKASTFMIGVRLWNL